MYPSFPETQRTWISQSLAKGEGGQEAATCHVMEVYFEPLTAYARRYVGNDAEKARDLASGFLADRMSRKEFLNQWIASGKSLRRWLLNGFAFFILETRRRALRHSTFSGAAIDELPGDAQSPESAFARAFAVSAVRMAMKMAEAECSACGHQVRWELYSETRYSGRPLSKVAEELGINPKETSGMLKFVAQRIIAALEKILLCDGASSERLSREIQEILHELQA